MGTGRIACLVACGLFLSPSGAALRIEGFATDLPNNEDAILVRNEGLDTVALGDVTIQDGNGELRFPEGSMLVPGSSVFLATNRTAFKDAFGFETDYALDAEEASDRLSRGSRSFALSNAGDRILLTDQETTVDAVVYGDRDERDEGWTGDPLDTPGTMFLRWFERSGIPDTDTARDWIPTRRSYVGEDLFPVQSKDINGLVVAYTAPEHSRAVVRETLLSAERSIRLNVYQFRDVALADELAARLRTTPGLHADILLDASPVGESSVELSERGHVIQILEAAGADVRMFTHERYAYNHAKYVVVDEEVLLVQTENFVPSGIPQDGRSGNRGWGLVIADAVLAGRAADVFDQDFRVRPFGTREAADAERPTFPRPAILDGGRTSSPSPFAAAANVSFIATPLPFVGDGDPIHAMIDNATTSIEVVQLDLAPRWRTPTGALVPHPYLDALVEAAHRGVRVRILLDGHFLDDGSAGDNADTVAFVDEAGRGTTIEARLRGTSSTVLHAKGMVVDGRRTLVGSMNWNSNSILQNREVGLILDDPTVGGFFRRSFETDWEDAGPPGVPSVDVVTVITLAGLALLIAGRRR